MMAMQAGLDIRSPGFARDLWDAAQQSYSLDPVMPVRKFGPHHVIPILRVGEGIAALTPHRPERAQFAHSVLRRTGWLTSRCSGGQCEAMAMGTRPPSARTAPK